MISIRLSDLEGPIADRRLIANADRIVRRRGLKIVGQEMRKYLRGNIKLAKRNRDGTYDASRPGGWPRYRSRVPRGFDADGKPILKKFNQGTHPFRGRSGILYAYDGGTETVVVGARRLRGSNMPRNLEFGGSRTVSTHNYSRTRLREVGKSGEIRLGGKRGRSTTKTARNTNIGTVRVTYAKIRTGAQAERANELNRRLYQRPGESPPTASGRKTVTTRARPFIAPTFRRAVTSGYATSTIAGIAYEKLGGPKFKRASL